MKKLLVCLSALLMTGNLYAFNMAYVEVKANSLENVGCYVRSDNNKPYFNITSIFAANINGTPNNPQIIFNDQVNNILRSTQVANLQKKGIKVLLTLLGNHQNAGWACMTDVNAIKKFANYIVTLVNHYHLDGIDIDDEYSICQPNQYSITMIAEAIKSNPKFAGKLLTKALFLDEPYFEAVYHNHKLSDYLDYGWEMSYGDSNFQDRIGKYLQQGMTADRLMIGGWTELIDPNPYDIGFFNINNHLAGNMIYDITNHSQNYLSQIMKSENNHFDVTALPNCLT